MAVNNLQNSIPVRKLKTTESSIILPNFSSNDSFIYVQVKIELISSLPQQYELR